MSTIRLELPVDDVNLVLEALGKLPFVQVYQLIGRIQAQAQAQMQGAQGLGGGDSPVRVEVDDGSQPRP
jgi:hypothetical protein